MNRPLILATILGASIGVPYVASQHWGKKQQSASYGSADELPGDLPAPPAAVLVDKLRLPIDSPGSKLYADPRPLEGVPVRSLAEVLRMDVTKEWVYQRWPRKSTGLADPELFGVRVPLVTGKRVTDLAGSLTYYFNRQGQVQHLSFLGRTGDTSALVNLLMSQYRFTRVDAPAGEQLYQVKRRGRVQSQLQIRPESVLWSTSPHSSFLVELELERPGSNRYLPPPDLQLVLPPVTASESPASVDNGGGALAALDRNDTSQTADDSDGGIFGEPRTATPEEKSQVIWKRWPN